MSYQDDIQKVRSGNTEGIILALLEGDPGPIRNHPM